jgi:hydroxyethylthiazole kinase
MNGFLNSVRSKRPLIHTITNYVTVNDCANILLAAGASPVMADDVREVREMALIASGLCLNIGTLNYRTVASMKKAGRSATRLQKPIVFDPVGAGATALRTKTAEGLIKALRPTLIKGNMSEIRVLSSGVGKTAGVDALPEDECTEANAEEILSSVSAYAKRTGAIVGVTGRIDVIASPDGRRALVYNGVGALAAISGCGCMLSCLAAGFIAANPTDPFMATVAAFSMMGLAGEITERKVGSSLGSFHTHLFDAISEMDEKTLLEGAKYELR